MTDDDVAGSAEDWREAAEQVYRELLDRVLDVARGRDRDQVLHRAADDGDVEEKKARRRNTAAAEEGDDEQLVEDDNNARRVGGERRRR